MSRRPDDDIPLDAIALEVADVDLIYAGPPRVTALDGVSLQVRKGEFVAIVGPSGAGKSSLLHVLGLLTTPTAGVITVAGRKAAASGDDDARTRSESIGFVFQAFHLLEERSVLENVALPLRYQRVKAAAAHARAADALESVGLSHRRRARARTLSGGERQRVAIARALVTDPAVLLCDEPTGNLDSTNSAKVIGLLRQLNARGHTIVIITHDESVASHVPRVVRLLDGKLVEDPGPKVAADPPRLPRPSTAGSGRSSHRRRIGTLTLPDLLDEAIGSLAERRWRSALTCLGTVLGVATLVSILGLASTASSQVSSQFDRLAATTVTVTSLSPRVYAEAQLHRVSRLNGVNGVAHLQPVQGVTVDAGVTSSEAVADSSLPVISATPQSWEVIVPRLRWGRTFDEALQDQRVAVLGAAAARQAGIYGPLGTQSILISGHPYVVIGVFDDVFRRSDLLLSVIIPDQAARADWGQPAPTRTTELVLATAVGAGPQVADEVPFALSPEAPDEVDVIPPPNPTQLRDDVAVDLTDLFLILAAVTLLVATVGIANTSLIAVMERVSEIGLRQAIGARRRSILQQFIMESVLIGAAGGLIGALVGIVVLLTVSVTREWTPVLPPWVIILAAPGGAVVGALAGLLPARRAAKVDPTTALRN